MSGAIQPSTRRPRVYGSVKRLGELGDLENRRDSDATVGLVPPPPREGQ
jgi:hypothetical protein